MVLMLCLGTAYADLPEPVSRWTFEGDASDSGSGGNDGTLEGNATIFSDSERGDVLSLDGTAATYVSTGAEVLLFHEPYTCSMWVKTTGTEMGLLAKSNGDGCGDDNWTEGEMQFYIGTDLDDLVGDGEAAVVGFGRGYGYSTTAINNGAWHHFAVTFDGTEGGGLVYVDGVEVTDEDSDYDAELSQVDNTGDTVDIGRGVSYEVCDSLNGYLDDVHLFDVALDAAQILELKDWIAYGPKNPLAVDANDVTIYEDPCTPLGDPYGNIYISLKFPPVGQGAPGNPDGTPISLEIIVDPNGYIDPCTGEVGGGGPNPDFTLIGESGPQGRVSFTRTTANWSDVEVIHFQAVDDDIPEYPTLDEAQSIAVWAIPTPYEPNLARPVAQKLVGGTVIDNDQPDIIFTMAPPAQVLEYRRCTFWSSGTCLGQWVTYPQTVGVSLQVPPKDGGLVKLTMGMDTMGINNPPTTDPVIWTDPNFLVFSADGATYKGIPTRQWDVPKNITVLGVDDNVLQADGASSEGQQNYTVALAFHIVESGIGQPYDPRYGDYNAQDEWEDKIEKRFLISIEDNECGAFGTLDMDISNPYYLMTEAELGALLGPDRRDPNDWMDENGIPTPDCHVDMYDVLEIAWRWFNCSDPQNLKPGGPCESYIIP